MNFQGLVHVARKMTKNMHAHFILGLMYQRMGQPQKVVVWYVHSFDWLYFIILISITLQAILAYEKAAEILLRSEEEIDRPELLSLVQLHHAQVTKVFLKNIQLTSAVIPVTPSSSS